MVSSNVPASRFNVKLSHKIAIAVERESTERESTRRTLLNRNTSYFFGEKNYTRVKKTKNYMEDINI